MGVISEGSEVNIVVNLIGRMYRFLRWLGRLPRQVRVGGLGRLNRIIRHCGRFDPTDLHRLITWLRRISPVGFGGFRTSLPYPIRYIGLSYLVRIGNLRWLITRLRRI